jgi:ABC-type multidrug transport system fused ATPase/permease subunit
MDSMEYGSIDSIPFHKTGADVTINAAEYSYPGGDKNVINGVTLSIYAGERFGIIGRSDSGKTTLLKLIKREADVTDGVILINGADVKDLSQPALTDIFENRIKIFDGDKALTEKDDRRTIISASNRVHAVSNCDRIAVIDGGVIIAVGKHEQLLMNCPLYKEMFDSQTVTPDKNEDDFSDILEKTE